MKFMVTNNRRHPVQQAGFTIVELLIATTIFTVVVLLVTVGIITIGRNYYKGITTARTQETLRSIEQDITQLIQVSGNTTIVTGTSASGINTTCIGDTRFTYVLNKPLATSGDALTDNHVLWMDKITSGGGCLPDPTTQESEFKKAKPNIPNSVVSNFNREVLANNMRVTTFNVIDVPGSNHMLYQVEIGLAYGEDDLFVGGNCRSINEGGQFCAKASVKTYVKRRL
jgi:type II secretory pathway pseudopilin PulG